MNIEEAQRVKKAKARATKEEKEALRQANELKQKEALEFLETRKIFVELLEGREDLFKQCKEFLFLNALVPNIGLNQYVNGDYAKGYRDALETFPTVLANYNRYKEMYEELKRGDN